MNDHDDSILEVNLELTDFIHELRSELNDFMLTNTGLDQLGYLEDIHEEFPTGLSFRRLKADFFDYKISQLIEKKTPVLKKEISIQCPDLAWSYMFDEIVTETQKALIDSFLERLTSMEIQLFDQIIDTTENQGYKA